MRLFIPDIGTEIELEQDWTFALHHESRNAKVWEKWGMPKIDRYCYERQGGIDWGNGKPVEGIVLIRGDYHTNPGALYLYDCKTDMTFDPLVKLPKGTVLKIARVYIRAGKDLSNFSSITFTLKKIPKGVLINGQKVKASGRFWVRLDDVNKMQIVDPHADQAAA